MSKTKSRKESNSSSSSVNSSIADELGNKSRSNSSADKKVINEEAKSVNYEKFKAKETKSEIDGLFE